MKTLIAFTTEYGTATYCAEKLQEGIKSEVDIVNLSESRIASIDEYDVVILGGGVHMGKIGREMKRFVKKHIEILKNKSVYLFICCLEKDTEEFFAKSFPQEVIDIAIDKYVFGGIINLESLSRTHRMVLQKIGKEKNMKKLKEKNIIKLQKVINKLNFG